MRFSIKLSILIFFSSWTHLWASLDFEDSAFPELVTSARALAMGNAYICKVDDAWAAFYNPAGLGTVRAPQFHLGNLHLEGSNAYMKAIGGPATDIPGNLMDSFDAQEMREKLADNSGKVSHLRANYFPNFTARGVTLGYFVSQRNRLYIGEDINNDPYEIRERRDHGPVFALNGSFFGGVFKVGASAKYLFRKELIMDVPAGSPVSISDNDYKEGSALLLTTGVRLTLPWTLLPTFAAVVHNASNNEFENPSKGGAPEAVKQTVDVGFSVTPQISKLSRLHLEVNLKDLNNAHETSARRRTAIGMEIDFSRRIFIRGGYGDGWGSGGIGLRSRRFIFDLSTYAVDRSMDGFRENEDRRWVLGISSGI